MKTNLKVLMFALLIGANFSANAYWGQTYVDYGVTKTKEGFTFVTTGKNWKDHYCYFTAGVLAIAGVAAGVAYLVHKKIEQKRAAKLAIAE